MRRKILFSFLFCGYIAAILVLCLMKPDSMPEKEFSFFGLPVDKVVHFTMFLPFSILAYMIRMPNLREKKESIIFIAIITILGTCMAFFTEYLQSLTDYRSSDIKDTIADITGVTTGSLAVLTYMLLKNKSTHIENE